MENPARLNQLEEQNALLKNQIKDISLQLELKDKVIRDREAELAMKMHEIQAKTDSIKQVQDNVQIMQTHINELDKNNEMYMMENSKLRREVENLKAVEPQLRSVKQQQEQEKEMRVTAEFDIQKLRLEI